MEHSPDVSGLLLITRSPKSPRCDLSLLLFPSPQVLTAWTMVRLLTDCRVFYVGHPVKQPLVVTPIIIFIDEEAEACVSGLRGGYVFLRICKRSSTTPQSLCVLFHACLHGCVHVRVGRSEVNLRCLPRSPPTSFFGTGSPSESGAH